MDLENNAKLKEEFAKVSKMSSYEKLAYIHNLVKFYKQIEHYSDHGLEETMDELFDRLLLITKDYK